MKIKICVKTVAQDLVIVTRRFAKPGAAILLSFFVGISANTRVLALASQQCTQIHGWSSLRLTARAATRCAATEAEDLWAPEAAAPKLNYIYMFTQAVGIVQLDWLVARL